MDQIIACGKCATKLKVRPEHAGRKVRCPKCRAVLAVPAALVEAEIVEVPLREQGIRRAPPGLQSKPAAPDTEGFGRRPERVLPRAGAQGADTDQAPPARLPKLGSLAQAARGRQLRGARILLVIIGILTIGWGIYHLVAAKDIVRNAIQAQIENRWPAVHPDPALVRQAEERGTRIIRLIAVADLLLGGVFVFLAIVIYRYPVASTVVGLVLYVSVRIIVIVMHPALLRHVFGLLIMVCIIIVLAKAVQAAIVYQRQRDAERDAQRRRRDEEEEYEPSSA